MNGADLLCDTLLHNDIDVCFANPGTSEMHFVAALDRKPEMRCILGLHETVVTAAADGYARMADKPAATLLHLGPGLANGFSNLHNARRARNSVLNVVGDHATYHLMHDAPLTTDIEAIAGAVSGWVGRANTAEEMSERTLQAIAGTRKGAIGQISTLILPANAAWGELPDTAPRKAQMPVVPVPSEGNIRNAALALKKANSVLIIGNNALCAKGTELVSRIQQVTGCLVRAEGSNRRMVRGAGTVRIDKVIYGVDLALADLASVEHAVLLSAKNPVAFFAYPGKPGTFLPPTASVTVACTLEECPVTALEMLAEAVGVTAAIKPLLCGLDLPDAPTGILTAEAIGAAVARNLPENAILSDESITNGGPAWQNTFTATPHDFISLTGGAIGTGFGLSLGAAVACPDRKVVSLQADGSGAYVVQGLWTQARERLDVCTVVFSNRRYAILRGELSRVGANAPGENAARMLDLVDPSLDWVKISEGFGVEAVRVETAEELDAALARAMKVKGPFLIEAVMP